MLDANVKCAMTHAHNRSRIKQEINQLMLVELRTTSAIKAIIRVNL